MSPCQSVDVVERNELHAIDALEESERELAHAHLESCLECRDAQAAIRRMVDELAGAIAITPQQDLRNAVLQRIGTTDQVGQLQVVDDHCESALVGRNAGPRPEARPRTQKRVGVILSMAAAVALVAGVGGGLVRDTDGQRSQPTAQLVAASLRTAEVSLASGPGDLDIRFSYHLDAGTGTLHVEGLAPLDQDETYAFWLIDQDGPQPAGLFAPADPGRPIELEVDGLDADVRAIGITIEPTGGSQLPTTQPLYVTDIS